MASFSEASAAAAPVGQPWLWTLAYGHHEDRTPTHGYAATREAVMASCHRRRREAELKKALGVPGLPRQLFANALMAGLARRSWFRRGLSQQSVRRNAIADDADSAVPLALDKGLPFGIGDKVGATVTNRARSDSLAHEVG